MPRLGRTLSLSAALLVFSWPPLLLVARGERPSYPLVTIVLALLMVGIVIAWDQPSAGSAEAQPGDERASPGPSRRAWLQPRVIAVSIVVVTILLSSAHRWVVQIAWSPYVADMLIVVREAARRFLGGHDPYSTYRTYDAPWGMVLPYGPALWLPFSVPVLLHTDLRVVTIVGEIFVPACCGLAAIVEAARGRTASAVAWIILVAAIVASVDLANFTVMGHTSVYWPLLPVFAVVVTRRRWLQAAFALGILLLARTTMVTLVPVFVMAVWADRRCGRRRTAAALAIVAATALAGLLPFALWDFHAMWDGMIASYPRIMKQVVWTSNDGGATNTIGVTGWLLSHHREHLVEVVQAIVMAITYAAAWRAIARGARPLPWMALALLAFSMTTLWPVAYIYFDVLLLFVAAAMADTLGRSRLTLGLAPWLLTLAGLIVVVATTLHLTTSALPAIAAGSSEGRRAFRLGFSSVERDGEREVAWVVGDRATVVFPRSSAAPADVIVACQGRGAPGGPPPTVTAVLNGRMLGTAHTGGGWEALHFTVPKSAWWIGFNHLELQLSPPAETGTFAVSDVRVVSRAAP